MHWCSCGFPDGSDDKESACNAGDTGSVLGLFSVPWRREWLPTPVFLPGEFHGQRSLAGYTCGVRHDWGTEHTHNPTWEKNLAFLKNYSICAPVKVLVVQSRPTLCNPTDCSPPGSSVHGFFRQEAWRGLSFPSAGDLSNPGIEPGSLLLQEDSLPFEPPVSYYRLFC